MAYVDTWVDFAKPYPGGWVDGSTDGTPITATILNNNYDSFLFGLNSWADELKDWADSVDDDIGTFITLEDIPTASTSTAGLVKVDGTSITIQNGVISSSGGGGGSSVSWSQIQATGTKIATITINNVDTDVYVPADTGDTVTWTQITGSGTKIATISINGTTTDVYAPTSGGTPYTDLTANISAGSTTVTINDASITSSSAFFPFSDPFGLVITNMVATTGSITLTYQAAATNYTLKVRVW